MSSSKNRLSLISCAVGGAITGWAAKMGMEKIVNRLKGNVDSNAPSSPSSRPNGSSSSSAPSASKHHSTLTDSPLGSSSVDGEDTLGTDDDFNLDDDGFGSEGADGAGSSDKNKSRSTKKACNFFVRTGRCSSGHECRYAHRFSECVPEVQRRVLLGRRAGQPLKEGEYRRTIGLLHPGEMGISLAACLLRRGHRVLWCGEGRSSATRLRAESFGLVEVDSLESMVAAADVIISLVPPEAASGLARAVAAAWAAVVRKAKSDGLNDENASLSPPVFLDLNPVSPSSVAQMRDLLAECGITDFVDGCLMGPPGWDMGTTRLYLAGDVHVHAIRALFTDFPVPPLQTPQPETNTANLGDTARDNNAAESEGDSAVPAWTKPRSPLVLESSSEVAFQNNLPQNGHDSGGESKPELESSSQTDGEICTNSRDAAVECAKPAAKGATPLARKEFPRVDPDSIRPAFFQVVHMRKPVGGASGLAMANAAWVKGSTALLISVHALAESLGVRQHLEQEWKRSQPGLSLFSRRKIPVAARKAWSYEGEMRQVADTYDAQGLPHAFHNAAAAVYRGLSSFKDIVRNSLNTRAATPRQRSGSASGGVTLPAVVSSLCFIMRNKGLRSTMKAAKLGVSRRHSAGSTGAPNAEHEASSSSDSDDDSVVFAEL
eukprot:INCI12768.1.p1 GENE.INCI12768.1~~INCI12768.1.p1  ORF type:complete len:660 (-),score=98.66 INCI12768.1:33-2012(-)